MKLSGLFLISFSFICLAQAWSAQDREIFDLTDRLKADVGPGVNFYEWIEVPKNADDAQIVKAYRKMSRVLHPDKNPSASATERFTRLGLIVQILRDRESRQRYEFFLDHGFPRWKGTDYYYSRFKPGFLTVLVFLYLLISFAHYWFLRLTAVQDRKRMASIKQMVLDQAGPIPIIPGAKTKVSLRNGRNFVVHSGTNEVCLLDEGKEYPLDIDAIKDPLWKDTFLFKLPLAALSRIFPGKFSLTGQKLGSKPENQSDPANPNELKGPRPKPALKVGKVRRR